ncbi:hypothetical protein CEXT_607341 [Caerostris extrusa]|uniref:Uncharacterized protein n=1 Tax=Caerostris extrusa TaxID=172846 RepID=A0AAV4V9G3_CAEEX|nr:hypothetical protein CEXT_607341 [Caerostris extrusa]
MHQKKGTNIPPAIWGIDIFLTQLLPIPRKEFQDDIKYSVRAPTLKIAFSTFGKELLELTGTNITPPRWDIDVF